MPPASPMRGFTLIEMLVTLTILGILITVALPSYNAFVRSQRVKIASFDVFSSLVLARSEALTRNSTVTVTPNSGTTDWAAGWRVLVGGTTLRNQEAIPNITMTGPAGVSYNGAGRLTAALATGIQITATGASVTTRCITVDLSGRPVTKVQSC
jgi:type IV fimbrial biogenesis protein FimT